jgi:aspartate/methionine/tyrosine aminotransferase
MILNSPSNPTGGVLARPDLERIAELVQGRPITVLSDEVYSRIAYGAEHRSIASLPGMAQQTILLDGFSKTYAMTGWRLGYGVMAPRLAEKLALMQVNYTSCAASFVQMAAIEALEGPQDGVDRMVAEFARRRAAIVAGLSRLPGVSCVAPEGAFYAFPNVSRYCTDGRTARDVANLLLERAGVAVVWGSSFGAAGEGYLRLSFANSLPNIQTALERMGEALEMLG